MAKMTKDQIKKAFAKARADEAKGQLDAAERGYKKILSAAPGLAEVHYNLGEIHTNRGRLADAAASFEAALKLRPNEPAIWIAYLDMASLHPNPKNFDILRSKSRPIIGALPAFAFFEGLAFARDGEHEAAAQKFKAAVSGGYTSARVFGEFGQTLARLGRSDDAMAQYDQALALAPRNDLVLYRKAELFRAIGDLEQAKVFAQRAIDAAPHMGGPYALYVSLGKVKDGDPNIAGMKAALKRKRAGDPDITTLCTSLAKAMEDTGALTQVFKYLNQGNAVAAKAYPYDLNAAHAAVERVQSCYLNLRDYVGQHSDAAPIFVTGAPRSGTTLVEQILASHSTVEGGGELGWLQPKVNPLVSEKTALSPDAIAANLVQHADAFGAHLQKVFPAAKHVTDKSISTYASLGILKKIMPKARFIVVRRNAADNALSIYKNQFEAGLHRYSTSLEHIAFFLRQFEETVAFWRQHCPKAFYEIRYEDLIQNPEAQSRALVEAAGLDWEDECLSFYNTKRQVRTLSSAQVRQPIYASSVGAWKKFEADMARFLRAYGAVE